MLLAVLVVTSGCTTKPGPAPHAGLIPAELGQLGVTIFANAPRVEVQVPDSKSSIAAEPINFEALSPHHFGIGPAVDAAGIFPMAAPFVAAACLAAPIAFIAASPVAQEARKLYGVVVADTAADIDEAMRILRPLCRTSSLEQMLQAQVLRQLAHHNTPAAVHTVPPPVPVVGGTERRHAVPGRLPASSGAIPPDERSYAELRNRGVRTVLEIKLLEPGLHGSEAINPSLAFTLHVRVRLLDTATGATMHYDYLEYASERHPLVTWAAADAQLFRQTVSKCIDAMSTEIVAQIFGLPGVVASDAQLATAGLYRRERADGRQPAVMRAPALTTASRYAAGP